MSALKATQASSRVQGVQLIAQVLLGLGFRAGIASGFSNSRGGIRCRKGLSRSQPWKSGTCHEMSPWDAS